MKTDVDTALKDIADWYIKNRRSITEPELESILLKHCEDEAEIQKFVKFLETEPGQLRFKTLLRERKEGGTEAEEWKKRESIADTVYGLQHGVKEEDIRKTLTRNPKGKYWYEPEEVEYIIREAKKQLGVTIYGSYRDS